MISAKPHIWRNFSRRAFLEKALLALIVLLIGSIIILCSVPPVSRDALTHHLAIPKLYLNHGGMYEIPAIVFSYFPPNLDLLYLVPLYFGNDIVPKFIHFAFALLTAWLIFSYLKVRLDRVYALSGGLFFLSLPIIVKLSTTVYVDLGLVFFSTGALIYLLKWVESDFKIHFLIISAVSCGLALGTKYNGLIVLFILTLFVPFNYISRQKRSAGTQSVAPGTSLKIQLKAIGCGIVFCLVALIIFSPWMIRNYVWQGNPIYPLYHNLFSIPRSESIRMPAGNQNLKSEKESEPASVPKPTRWSSLAIRRLLYGESWWEIALIPVRIFFQGQDGNPKYFDGKLNPFLFILPIFAFVKLKTIPTNLRTEQMIFASFAVLYLLYASANYSVRIRYIAPIIPPLIILAMYGLHRINSMITGKFSVPARKIAVLSVLAVAAWMFGMNGAYLLRQFQHIDPLSYLSGRLDRDAYIERYRPEYAALRYANDNLPNRSKILAIFLGNRLYYSDREMIFGDRFFQNSVKRATRPADILAELKQNDISHILIRHDLFNSWSNRQLEDNNKKILARFIGSHMHRIFSKGGYGLYRL
ncbi:hypothetical protein D1BOALGB6SA_4344 [Olavius sp. associated proteobacterium Delta 1]|nr:hypothetical protein D1BOALGB6SA_4344 [Olavius sp. associated proteobacterium Delta 1]